MNLPAIFNRNSEIKVKETSNKLLPMELGFGKGQFGLGIQVFKIQSQKSVFSSDPKIHRKLIKSIQNPNTKPPIPRKNLVLPVIQKQTSQKIYSDAIKTRKNINQNRKINSHSNNQTAKTSSISKSITQPYPSTKQNNQLSQKSNVFIHYNPSLNQIVTFYTDYQTETLLRQRQIRKINKLNESDISQPMKMRLQQLRQTKIVDYIVNNQQISGYVTQQDYEQNPITQYTINEGFRVNNYQNYRKQ